MDELLFPLAAVTATFFIAIPLLTLLSRRALAVQRERVASWTSFGSEATFALLAAPVLLPVLWLTSSALHQSESTRESCLVDHFEATTCIDAVLLLSLMVVGIAAAIGFRLWRERPRVVLHQLAAGHDLVRRVARIAQGDAHLRSLRIVVVHASAEPIYTRGLLRPIVVVDACFIRDTDAQLVRAALLHEHAHIAGFDTFRSFVVRLCLTINPARTLLAPDFERWRSAREAACDGEAVHRGGEALALAEGIIRAARFRCGEPLRHGAALCGHSAAALRLRLALLMNGPPVPARTRGHVVLALGLLAALVVPHIHGLGLLEHFHFEVERLLHSSL